MANIYAAKCLDRQRIVEFLGGRCPEEEAEEIARHSDECAPCAALLRELTNSGDTVGRIVKDLDERLESEPAFRDLRARLLDLTAPALSTPPLPLVLGQYELLAPLGEGGMGRVFKARHRHLKRLMAIKLLVPELLHDQDAVNRFLVEMEAIGRLSHPHLVRATDAACVDGMNFSVMDFEAGLDLGELLRRVARLRPPDACEMIRQAALGLQFAHENGLIHCDIKPSNLFLTEQGIIKVLDLGLARIGSERSDGSSPVIAGTIDYMAPEQWVLGGPVDIRADIYGLGCTLFKLLTGRAPFETARASVDERRFAHQSGEIPSLAVPGGDLPEGLESVVRRMLAKQPDERFAQPRDVAEALAPFCDGSRLARLVKRAGQTPGETVRVQDATETLVGSKIFTRPRSQRRRVLLLAILLGVAATVAAGLILALRDPGERNWKSASLAEARSFTSRDANCVVAARQVNGRPALELQSGMELFVPLGSAEKLPCRFRFRVATKFEGAPGIYYGYSKPLGTGKELHSYHAITLVHTAAPRTGRVRWCVCDELAGHARFRDYEVASWEVPIDESQEFQMIDAAITGAGLRIAWNGAEIVANARPAAEPSMPPTAGLFQGDFGLYLGQGRAVFDEFQSNLHGGN